MVCDVVVWYVVGSVNSVDFVLLFRLFLYVCVYNLFWIVYV